jgi:hypothetical protein
MLDAITQWNEKPDKAATEHTVCHLIEGFLEATEGIESNR